MTPAMTPVIQTRGLTKRYRSVTALSGHRAEPHGRAGRAHRAPDHPAGPRPRPGARHFRGFITYQPADRYWAFRGIETGIFVLLGAALLAVTAYALVRRDALPRARHPGPARGRHPGQVLTATHFPASAGGPRGGSV